MNNNKRISYCRLDLILIKFNLIRYGEKDSHGRVIKYNHPVVKKRIKTLIRYVYYLLGIIAFTIINIVMLILVILLFG